jgi:hypothetical protein
MTDESTFSLAEALAAQKALRDAAGAEEEVFELADVIGMVSDEVDMLKEQGRSLGDIAALVQQATGKPVTAEDVEKYYVPADERELWDDDEDEEDNR